jgi:regulator of nucleoside diphosphate kinase
MIRVKEPWVIVLAGGSGERLRAVTTTATGALIPKQFCRLGGRTSMLGMTLARARRITATDRILVLVREEHRPWWQTEVGSAEQVLVQSRNRGTGLALLRALLHLHERDPGATAVVLPSDHVVDDEDLMDRAVLDAVDAARVHAGQVVLIGAPAGAADPSLGWILPERGGAGRTRQVAGFVEKPSVEEATACVRRGALRNTLILTGNVRAFLRLYALELLEPLGSADMSDDVLHATISGLAAIYAEVPGMDLSRDILQRSSRWLRVLPLPECGWTDIGTLERLEAWWKSHPRSFAEVREFGVLPVHTSIRGGAMSKHTIEVTDADALRLNELLARLAPHSGAGPSTQNSLRHELDRARVVPAGEIGPDVVTMQSRVLLEDADTHESVTYTLVEPEHADLEAGLLSVLAPIGTAILGYAEGDVVEWPVPAGVRHIRIQKVLHQPEAVGRRSMRSEEGNTRPRRDLVSAGR